MMSKKVWWMILGVTSLTLLLGACAGTLPDDFEGASFKIEGEPSTKLGAEVEFTGVLIPQDDESWSIEENNFLITDLTEIKGDLAPGQIVKVHAFLNEEGQLVAREIELAEKVDDSESSVTDDDDEEEFFGVLESVEGDVWTINGVPVVMTNLTEIKGSPAVGDMVKVHVSFSEETNQWVAREIEIASGEDRSEDQNESPNDDELYGTIESIEGDVWTINGTAVLVSEFTHLDDDFSVGDFVEVHFVFDEDGNLVALEVELESEDDDDSSSTDYDDDDDNDDDPSDHDDDADHDDDEDDNDHDDDESDDDED